MTDAAVINIKTYTSKMLLDEYTSLERYEKAKDFCVKYYESG
jgi:hypothetical protein